MEGGRNRWLAEAPGRAETYDDRWAELAAKGENVHGEADLVEWLLRSNARPAPSSVLDAGCGTGRVGAELARRGFDVVGVDLDPTMLGKARSRDPEVRWIVGDLADAGLDFARTFDLAVLAGNVLIYVEPGTEGRVVANLARHLAPGATLVAGFQLEPGRLDLATYDDHAAAAGMTLAERWSTWDRRPFAGGSYAVSVHLRP